MPDFFIDGRQMSFHWLRVSVQCLTALLLPAIGAFSQANDTQPATRTRLAISTIEGASVRQMPLIGESSQVPVWSPDGRAIVFQVRDSGRNLLALVQHDGSNLRLFRDQEVATGQHTVWSPNSRFIGFLDPARHSFRVLDVSTGLIRTITTDSTGRVGAWRWRSDGQSIAAVITTPGPTPGLRNLRRRIDEIAMNGTRRTILDTAAMRGVPGVTFIDGITIFVRFDTAAYQWSLDGAPRRRRVAVLSSNHPAAGVHKTSPRTSMWAGVSPGNPLDSGKVEFISLLTGERRELKVPFHPTPGPSPEWTPDGRELVVVGWELEDTAGVDAETIQRARAGDTSAVNHVLQRQRSLAVIYRVPVGSGRPRLITRFQAADGWVNVSPDGRHVVYSTMVNAGGGAQ